MRGRNAKWRWCVSGWMGLLVLAWWVGSGCGESVSQGGVDCPAGGCEPEEEAPAPVPDVVETWEEPSEELPGEPEPLDPDPCGGDAWCAWRDACDGQTSDALVAEAPLCPLQAGVCAGAVRTCGDADPEADCADATYALQTEHPVDPGGVDRWCDGLDNTCSGVVDPGCCAEDALDAWWEAAWSGVHACGHGAFLIPLMVRPGEGYLTEVSIEQRLGYQLHPDLPMEELAPPELRVRAVVGEGHEEERVPLVHVFEGQGLAALDATLPSDWNVVLGRGTPHGLVLDLYRWRGEGVHHQTLGALVGWEPDRDALGGSLWAAVQQQDDEQLWIWLRSGEQAALALAHRRTGLVELLADGARAHDPSEGPSTTPHDGSFRPMTVNPWLAIEEEAGRITACVVLRGNEEDTLHCDQWQWDGASLVSTWSTSAPLGHFSWDAAWLSNHPPELPLVRALPAAPGEPLRVLEVTEEGATLRAAEADASIRRWERANLMDGRSVGLQTTGEGGQGRVAFVLDGDAAPTPEQEPLWSVDRAGIDADAWSIVHDGRLHYLSAVRWQPVQCLPMPDEHVERFGVALRHLPLSADGWPWCGGVLEAAP